MRCPHCNAPDSRVLESRLLEDDTSLRRRRECPHCNRRFTNYERVEVTPLLVVKRGGAREPFDPRKLATGILRACAKCQVSVAAIEQVVAALEAELVRRGVREVPSWEIGELTLERLKVLDEVAYVRFASVYRQFSSIEDFICELSALQSKPPVSTR